MRYVYEVYRQKSFSKAARRLYISQPSLSLTVKKVEGKVGRPLFDRSSSPIGLTECGREYIACVEKIMAAEAGFQSYLGALDALSAGSLAIGASNFFASYVLPPLIARYKTLYPGVELDLMEADTPTLEQLLQDGTLDLIIDNYDFDEGVYTKRFFYREHLLIALPGHLVRPEMAAYALDAAEIRRGRHLADMPAIPGRLLREVPFILLRGGNDTRTRADRFFEAAGVRPAVLLELDQLATAFHMAGRGLGATFASDTMVQEASPKAQMTYFRLPEDIAARDNHFYYKTNRYLGHAAEKLMAMGEGARPEPGGRNAPQDA